MELKYLFDESRLPDGLHFLLFIIYFPFGCFLTVLRLFIGLQVFIIACVLPKLSTIRSLILRVMCTVLGIIVQVSDKDNRDPSTTVLVSNHRSTLDHLAIDLCYPSIVPCVWDLPPTLIWLLGYKDMGAKNGRTTLITNAKQHCTESKTPILVFPEGASTNGKCGLLKFSAWPFSLEQPVQPLTITLNRPFMAKLATSILGGRWWVDVLCFFFVPYTLFTIKMLSVETQLEDEETQEFAQRVQYIMANSLDIQPTVHTSSDKVEYNKRKYFVKPVVRQPAPSAVTSSPTSGVGDRKLLLMVQQVQEVLPNVPQVVISNDLAMTKDVDLTISNLLEGSTGTITATPIKPKPGVPKPAKAEASKASTAAQSFSRNANTRQMSLKERKDALLQCAKQQYITKHGITS